MEGGAGGGGGGGRAENGMETREGAENTEESHSNSRCCNTSPDSVMTGCDNTTLNITSFVRYGFSCAINGKGACAQHPSDPCDNAEVGQYEYVV
eukprot:5626669-Pyramimonas_sp.AAC.1